jgi:hypothetical protein
MIPRNSALGELIPLLVETGLLGREGEFEMRDAIVEAPQQLTNNRLDDR